MGAITAKFWPGNERQQFIMQLKITFIDGSTEWIKTGEGWKAQLSAITDCEYEKGEKCDLKKLNEDWDKPDYDDNSWLVQKFLIMN